MDSFDALIQRAETTSAFRTLRSYGASAGDVDGWTEYLCQMHAQQDAVADSRISRSTCTNEFTARWMHELNRYAEASGGQHSAGAASSDAVRRAAAYASVPKTFQALIMFALPRHHREVLLTREGNSAARIAAQKYVSAQWLTTHERASPRATHSVASAPILPKSKPASRSSSHSEAAPSSRAGREDVAHPAAQRSEHKARRHSHDSDRHGVKRKSNDKDKDRHGSKRNKHHHGAGSHGSIDENAADEPHDEAPAANARIQSKPPVSEYVTLCNDLRRDIADQSAVLRLCARIEELSRNNRVQAQAIRSAGGLLALHDVTIKYDKVLPVRYAAGDATDSIEEATNNFNYLQ